MAHDRALRVGVDLDNTIICYDRVLAAAAEGLGPNSRTARGKHAVKAAIEREHGADAWTELQAELYGPRLVDADPFPGVLEFFCACRMRGIPIAIVSHKTRFPARGARHDLRDAAMAWLDARGWFAPEGAGLTASDVEFHDTQAAKLNAIAARRCTVFVDDLPEIFLATAFPRDTSGVLFDPPGAHVAPPRVHHARSWDDIAAHVLGVRVA